MTYEHRALAIWILLLSAIVSRLWIKSHPNVAHAVIFGCLSSALIMGLTIPQAWRKKTGGAESKIDFNFADRVCLWLHWNFSDVCEQNLWRDFTSRPFGRSHGFAGRRYYSGPRLHSEQETGQGLPPLKKGGEGGFRC